jgi:hypothetical protein
MDLRVSNLDFLELLVLKKLQTLGPKTKFQLMSLGLKSTIIYRLETLGILVRQYNSITNLNQYVVCENLFEE